MNNLDEVLHSTKQMVNEHRHAYPPVWYEDATKIIEQARAELAELRAVVEAARKARIALTFYRQWMYENRDKTQYPFGKETEDELSAALERVTK